MTVGRAPSVEQVSFDDLSTPLYDVTFAVLDLETTGLSPTDDRITEVGVVKAHRGEVLGEFATLVHPGRPIPTAITSVTGITDRMVAGQPPVESVLPSLLEFLRGTVLVAHNASFDTRFLAAALQRAGYPPLHLPVVDTAAVARRVLRDEVRSCRLAELSRHYRSPVMPEHRALADARATLHVLYGLLERVGVLGATTLQDLQDYAKSTSDRAFRKIDLVRDAPSAPGVYRFLDERDRVLYVGKAEDLRRRLRNYFGQDRRRRVADLVRETRSVAWTVTPTDLEGAVREVRLIHEHRPRYNRRSKFPERSAWVTLTDEAFPRLSVVTRPKDRPGTLGPLPSRRIAQVVVDAIQTVSPIRQCTTRLRVAQDHPSCVLKQLGRCESPCDGTIDRETYAVTAEAVGRWLDGDVAEVLAALDGRMRKLAADGRFEDAATVRARLHTIARQSRRHRRMRRAAAVRELIAEQRSGDVRELVLVRHGRLAASHRCGADTLDAAVVAELRARGDGFTPPSAVTAEDAEEIDLVAAWLDRPRTRLLSIDGCLVEPIPAGAAIAQVVSSARSVEQQLRKDRHLLRGDKIATQGTRQGRGAA